MEPRHTDVKDLNSQRKEMEEIDDSNMRNVEKAIESNSSIQNSHNVLHSPINNVASSPMPLESAIASDSVHKRSYKDTIVVTEKPLAANISTPPAESRSRDINWLLWALRPDRLAGRAENMEAMRELKRLAKTGPQDFWDNYCAQVLSVYDCFLFID